MMYCTKYQRLEWLEWCWRCSITRFDVSTRQEAFTQILPRVFWKHDLPCRNPNTKRLNLRLQTSIHMQNLQQALNCPNFRRSHCSDLQANSSQLSNLDFKGTQAFYELITSYWFHRIIYLQLQLQCVKTKEVQGHRRGFMLKQVRPFVDPIISQNLKSTVWPQYWLVFNSWKCSLSLKPQRVWDKTNSTRLNLKQFSGSHSLYSLQPVTLEH